MAQSACVCVCVFDGVRVFYCFCVCADAACSHCLRMLYTCGVCLMNVFVHYERKMNGELRPRSDTSDPEKD